MRSRLRHRVVRVRGGEEARARRNARRGQPPVVAGAVEPLVRQRRQRRDRAERIEARQDPLREVAVHAHALALRLRQRARLVPDVEHDAGAPDVVQVPGPTDRGRLRQPLPLRRAPRERRDARRMTAREARLHVAVLTDGLDRGVERLARQAQRLARLGLDQRVVHRRHLQRREQCLRATREDLDQLRIVAAARAPPDQRDRLVGPEQPPGRLRVRRELDEPHDAIDRLALEAIGTPAPVPAFEHLGHRARHAGRQTEPLGEQPAHLAVRARRHARPLPERVQHLADPPRERVAATDVPDQRAHELGRRAARHVRDPVARILAQHANAEVLVARAPDGLQQRDVERVARVTRVEAGGIRQRDRHQRRALRVLQRHAQADVGRERQARRELRQSHALRPGHDAHLSRLYHVSWGIRPIPARARRRLTGCRRKRHERDRHSDDDEEHRGRQRPCREPGPFRRDARPGRPGVRRRLADRHDAPARPVETHVRDQQPLFRVPPLRSAGGPDGAAGRQRGRSRAGDSGGAAAGTRDQPAGGRDRVSGRRPPPAHGAVARGVSRRRSCWSDPSASRARRTGAS